MDLSVCETLIYINEVNLAFIPKVTRKEVLGPFYL